MSDWFRRVWHLFNRSRRERELLAEMREHRAAMHDPAAFGDPHRLLERSRDAWGWNWLDDAVQDLRLAVRSLKRSPGFSLTAVLMLSFGVGLNLTVFQVANVVLLRPPPLVHPNTLARWDRHGRALRSNSEAVPYAAAMAVAREDTALSAVLTKDAAAVVWGEPRSGIEAALVSTNWFSQIGDGALLGRVFTPEIDGRPDAGPAAIASYRFWKTTLGGDPSVIGRTVRINNRPATLVGVLPERFPELDLDTSAIWLPINQRDYYFPNSTFLTDWSSNNVAMYGRFKDGVSKAAARESLRGVVAELHREHPDDFDADDWLEPAMATDNFTEPQERYAFIGVASTIGLLALMVLIVAAANLGNLVMSRATSRVRELGVRVALGAGRSRIVRQLVIETMPLGIMGASGGLLLAGWATSAIAAFGQLPPYLDFSPDRIEIDLALFLAAVALAIVAALPAWKISRQDLTEAIKDGGQQVSMRLDRARVRSVMLALQVGGSCVVLMISAMMVRSLQSALTADPGFTYQQGAVVQAGLAAAGLKADAARSFWFSVEDRIAESPETASKALALSPPFVGRARAMRYPEAPRLRVSENHVEPEYFSTLQIPLLAGRSFRDGDDAAAAVIISRTLAERMYGGASALGQGFPKSAPHDTVIGIVGDTSSVRPGDTTGADLYRPLSVDDYERVILLVRARSRVEGLLTPLREAAQADPRVFGAVRLLRDDFDLRMSSVRISSAIGASVGVLTLWLACVGIFGVVSYAVTLRTREVGIHLALGASRSRILRVVTRQIIRPVSAGFVFGTVVALPIGVALAQSPLRLAFADPVSYASALLILGASAGMAALLPALRALRADPMTALRHQ